ncbi:hypothetical protein ABH927_000016 [Planotetraspora sp. GP83]
MRAYAGPHLEPLGRITMTRQIADGFQNPTLIELEARVRGLETQVAHLTELVKALSGDQRESS